MTDQPISLEEIRLRLNELDDQLLSLLSERRKLSIEVAKAKYKPQNRFVMPFESNNCWLS